MNIKGYLECRWDLLKRIINCFFFPKKFVAQCEERLEKLSASKKEKTESEKVEIIRRHIWRAFKLLIEICIYSFLIFSLFRFLGWEKHSSTLGLLKVIGYCFVLWGVLSSVGWPLRTWCGETLPEIFDEEWHRFAYGVGLILLIASYLLEIFSHS